MNQRAVITWIAAWTLAAVLLPTSGSGAAQQWTPEKRGSDNLTVVSHLPLGPRLNVADIEIVDGSDWYRAQAVRAYARMTGTLYPRMCEALGVAQADHFVENWRAMVIVCEKGEMRQTYSRARKQAAG